MVEKDGGRCSIGEARERKLEVTKAADARNIEAIVRGAPTTSLPLSPCATASGGMTEDPISAKDVKCACEMLIANRSGSCHEGSARRSKSDHGRPPTARSIRLAVPQKRARERCPLLRTRCGDED